MRVVPLTGLPGGDNQALAFFSILLGGRGAGPGDCRRQRGGAPGRPLRRARPRPGRAGGARRRPPAPAAAAADRSAAAVRARRDRRRRLSRRWRRPRSSACRCRPASRSRSRSRPTIACSAFAVAAALAAGLIFGLGPALQGARRDITDRLKAESAGTGRRRSRLGRVLVAGQLALSLVLLVAAGLFVRAIDRGAGIDPGFDRSGRRDAGARTGVLGLRRRPRPRRSTPPCASASRRRPVSPRSPRRRGCPSCCPARSTQSASAVARATSPTSPSMASTSTCCAFRSGTGAPSRTTIATARQRSPWSTRRWRG